MSENKRFDVYTELLHIGIGITDNGKELTGNDVVTLLNQLTNENEELKKENQQLKEQILRWEHIACTGIHYNNILRQRSEKND